MARSINEHFDVIVVGGGVIGCSVAFYLARAGCRVVVLERGAFGAGASAANPGSVALSSKQPGLSLRMAIASRLLYESLSEEIGSDIELAVDGNLTVAETDAELQFIRDLSEKQSNAGIPVRIVSADECRQRNWLLEGSLAGGAHCPVDAHCNPFLVTAGFARAAAANGADLRSRVEVSNAELGADGIFLISTSAGPIFSRFLINACGLNAPRIGSMLGVEHKVLPRAGHVMALEATPGLPLVKTASASQLMAKHQGSSGHGIALSYNRKPRSGTVLLGGSNQLGVDSTDISPEVLSAVCAYGIRFMPSLARLNVVRAWVGLRPYSPSGPMIGRCGGPSNYLAAFGHGGDGMALAPITGRYIAELVRRYPEELPMDEFLETLDGRAALGALAARISSEEAAA